jgi:hypothetical protein
MNRVNYLKNYSETNKEIQTEFKINTLLKMNKDLGTRVDQLEKIIIN